MKKPKLIILYGFAASGKTTLAKRYIEEHPLTIAIEGDQLIGMISGWRKNEEQARKMVLEDIKSTANNHLHAGHDVLIPHLLYDESHPKEFSEIAKRNGAVFHEVYIDIDEEDAVGRLIKRGCWGEEGSRKLTEEDRPELMSRFKHMNDLMKKHPNVTSIHSEFDDIEGTYKNFLKAIR